MNSNCLLQEQENISDSESSEATILSSNESFNESLPDNCEIAKILNQKLQLPKDLCEDRQIFQELFSISTWNNLTNEDKEHLKQYLPTFSEDSKKEQENTIQQLFSNKIFRFGQTPIDSFHANLQDGNYRPDIAHYRKRILKEEERDQRIKECERISLMAEKMVISREKQLKYAYSSGEPISTIPDDKLSRSKLSASIAAMRGNKRYFQELLKIFDELNYSLSDDETIPNRSHLQLSKKQIKQFKEQDNTQAGIELRIVSTTSTKEKNWDHMTESNVSNEKYKQMLKNFRKRKSIEPDHTEMEFGEIKLKDIISRSSSIINPKKLMLGNSSSVSNKKPLAGDSFMLKQEISNKPVLNTSVAIKNQISKITNRNLCKVDVQEKPLKIGSHSETDEEDFIKANIIKVEPTEGTVQSNPNINQKGQKQPYKLKIPYQQQQQVVNTNIINRKRSNVDTNIQPRVGKKIIIDAGGIVKSSFVPRSNPVVQNSGIKKKSLLDVSNSSDYEVVEYSPELTRNTQNCFLSLIRDIFCSTADHRIKLEELRKKINVWLKNPIAPTNIWYKDAEHWGSLLISAVHFLSGEFQDQPQHFVPYLEFKSQLNIYQWIGAGRDSDGRMLSLNQYWLSRHNEMGIKASNTLKQKPYTKIVSNPEKNESNYLLQSISPPNQRCKSNWKVKSPTKPELAEFQVQEQKRFENPYFPFIYNQHGYESVVGPLRDMHLPISVITKARDNSVLLADRPSYVTTVAIVRDAIARLPNGEGTFEDICELVKYSKYLTLNLTENVVKSFVSTALDSISSENPDPSAKFDNKRKLWIYMHRNRTEEEFERIYQQQQGIIKPKKMIYRKVTPTDSVIRVSTNNLSNIAGSTTNIKVSKINTDPEILQQMPSLAVFDTKKVSVTHSSPPPLKISPKRFIKTVNMNEKCIEPFDAEASLDAQIVTTPIVKTADNKNNCVILKTSSQLSPLQANTLNQSAINTNRAQSPKISTILASKKVVGKPIMLGQNENVSIVSQSNSSTNSNYIVTMNSSNIDKIKSSEPPALQPSFQQVKTTIPQKNIVMVSSNAERTSLSPQQSPKLLLAASSSQLASQKGGKIIALPRNQTPMLSQQKQILTNVIVQQQKAKSGQNQILVSTNKTQKIPLTISSSTSVPNSTTSTSLIQIQQPSTSITTSNANSAKQTVFQLRHLKQDGSQQTMILKPQIVKTVAASSDLPAPPLIVNKIIKSTPNTAPQTSQIVTSTSQKIATETSSSPIFARVVSAAGRQLIDGILPKNSGSFKLANTGGVQQNVLQLSGPSQYTVVSKGKTVLSPTAKITTNKSNTSTNLSSNQNILITSHSNTSNQTIVQTSPSVPTQVSTVQQQPLKIVQGGTLTAQQLLNAKLINVQTLGNKGFKQSSGIKMINTQGYITNLGTKTTGLPIIIAGKGGAVSSNTNASQGIVLQANPSQNNTFILNPNQTTLKMQGNILSQPQQTVVLGNQVLKVQPFNQIQTQKIGTSTVKSASETVVIAANPGKAQTINNPPLVNQEVKQPSSSNSPGQQIILGSTIKVLKNMITKSNNVNQQTARVVLTPSSSAQGGQQFAQQIIIPANFQGIKSLQGLKVIQQTRLGSNNVGSTSGINENKQTSNNQQEESTNE